MNLFDLPLDVFLSILEQTVVAVSNYRELARLRLVCSMYSVYRWTKYSYGRVLRLRINSRAVQCRDTTRSLQNAVTWTPYTSKRQHGAHLTLSVSKDYCGWSLQQGKSPSGNIWCRRCHPARRRHTAIRESKAGVLANSVQSRCMFLRTVDVHSWPALPGLDSQF